MNSKNTAPIVLFCYNRPSHTLRTLEALKKNSLAKDSELFIFCDGSKNQIDAQKVAEVYKIIDNIDGFKNVVIEKSDVNKGLANSIISGVSKIVAEYGKIIVLEDDLVVSPFFLDFMNDGLNFYKNEERVISIHGYVYDVKKKMSQNFFLRGADCWGWATWKRGWDLFNASGQELLKAIREKNLTKKFDFEGAYEYTKMLEDQIAGKNNSWAIRWHASAFLANKLTLYPRETLVQNIGFDDSGTHCGSSVDFEQSVSQEKIAIDKIEIEENKIAIKRIKIVFKPRKGLIFKLINKFKKKIAKKKLKKLRKNYGWFSTDLSFKEIVNKGSSYDSKNILEKCRNSLLKAKFDDKYERDSVIFDKIEYSWPLLSLILLSATKNLGKVDVVDFGGSLGSSYFQNRKFFSQIKDLKYSVIEQGNFVEEGNKYFADDKLKFFNNFEECFKERSPNLLILSSVLQYLENPQKFLQEIEKYNFDFIAIDRTGFIDEENDLLTLQKVPPEIYEASYPCWIFAKKKFVANLLKSYEIIEEFDSGVDRNVIINGNKKISYSGFLLRKNAK